MQDEKRLETREDGGVGKHALPPCTTTEKITTRPQNNTQNHQKIKLNGSPTTKDLKKPHSFRWVGGGVETWCGLERQQNRQSHIHMWWIKLRTDTSGARDPIPRHDHTAQGSRDRKMNPHNFWL